MDMFDTKKSPSKEIFTNILGEVLETCIHEILYNRHLYPRDAFVPTRYLGVRCHACRIPLVVDYIVDALMVAVPSIVSGSIDCLSLIIFDANKTSSDSETVLEKYNFEFDPKAISSSQFLSTLRSSDPMTPRHQEASTSATSPNVSVPQFPAEVPISKALQELEWGLKQLLLRIITLEGYSIRSQPLPQSVTFKICMRTFENNANEDKQIPVELEKALQEGKWFEPNVESCTITSIKNGSESTSISHQSNTANDAKAKTDKKSFVRPLKAINVLNYGLRLNLSMEINMQN